MALAAVVGAALAAGVTWYVVGRDVSDVRAERTSLQRQLEDETAKLTSLESVHAADAARDQACEQLSADARQLSADWAEYQRLWNDPAFQSSEEGSPEEQAFYLRGYQIEVRIDVDGAKVQNDAVACTGDGGPA